MNVAQTMQRPGPVLGARVIETEADRHSRVARRLGSWLASEPAPVDMIDAIHEIARRLEDGLPGGLTIVTADVYLDILCQSLLYCDLADLMAVWPGVKQELR